jgi:hypothetical protein
MPKMKVVEFFKLYNIALRFKFKKPKFTALHIKFWVKVEFEFFCPYQSGFDEILDMFTSFHGMSWWLVYLHVSP